METVVPLDLIDFEATLAAMKPHQRRIVVELRDKFSPEEAVEYYLTVSGAVGIHKFGGGNGEPKVSYVDAVKNKLRELICPKKGSAGKNFVNNVAVKGIAVAYITQLSVIIGPAVSLPPPLLVPVLFILLEFIATVGLDSWCDCTT